MAGEVQSLKDKLASAQSVLAMHDSSHADELAVLKAELTKVATTRVKEPHRQSRI